MSRFFISYSRVDKEVFARPFAQRLHRMFPTHDIWWDEELTGGDVWWDEILRQIAQCDVFIYLLSNESVTSPYCHAEFTEARRLQKRIVTVQVRDRTRISDELGDLQYVDMKNGVNDATATADLVRAVNKALDHLPARRPRSLWEPRTPRPRVEDKSTRSEQAEDVETPTLTTLPAVPRSQPVRQEVSGRRLIPWVFAAAIIGILVLVLVILPALNQAAPVSTPTEGLTLPTSESASPTETPTQTVPPSETPTEAATTAVAVLATTPPTPTETPHPLTEIVQRFTESAGTATAYVTETAAAWTSTPTPTATATPNLTATYRAYWALVAPTLITWTPTPTAREAAIQRANAFQGSNDDWEPYIETFAFDNGVSIDLALVPVGCFSMGEDGEGGEQCFDEPFWIGRYEVTNAQYAPCVDAGACDEPGDYGTDFNAPDQPVVEVSWFNARQYVEWLSAISGLSFSLPTEAEWEYAARGPDGLEYPWGSATPLCDLLNFYGCVGHTAQVGSYSPAGDSWVGAADMAGNVWEWVNSIYQNYPYDPGDGRESLADASARRVVRGGSWLDLLDLARGGYRPWLSPVDRDDFIGFRVCRPHLSDR